MEAVKVPQARPLHDYDPLIVFDRVRVGTGWIPSNAATGAGNTS